MQIDWLIKDIFTTVLKGAQHWLERRAHYQVTFHRREAWGNPAINTLNYSMLTNPLWWIFNQTLRALLFIYRDKWALSFQQLLKKKTKEKESNIPSKTARHLNRCAPAARHAIAQKVVRHWQEKPNGRFWQEALRNNQSVNAKAALEALWCSLGRKARC